MSYITIEGPIGVGKTSLSKLLAEELNARVMHEVVEENPFLAPFYSDPEAYAFKVQVFFLLSRYKQVQDLNQGALFFQHTVSDYFFDKDFIFASMNLSKHEWELYKELYEQLRPKLTQPDVVIYLKAEPDLLLQRIAKRDRSFERNMKAAYLRQLSQAYDDYFATYTGRVHTIDASKFDFVNNPNDRDDLINEILQFAQAA